MFYLWWLAISLQFQISNGGNALFSVIEPQTDGCVKLAWNFTGETEILLHLQEYLVICNISASFNESAGLANEYELCNLLATSYYRLELVLVINNGTQYSGDIVTILTPVGAPLTFPLNVKATTINSSSVNVTWDFLPHHSWGNYKPSNYRVDLSSAAMNVFATIINHFDEQLSDNSTSSTESNSTSTNSSSVNSTKSSVTSTNSSSVNSTESNSTSTNSSSNLPIQLKNDCQFDGLPFYNEFIVTVSAFNGYGYGPDSPATTVFTDEIGPTSSPDDFRLSNVLHDSVNVTWGDTDLSNNPGNLTGHTVFYQAIYTKDEMFVGIHKERKRKDLIHYSDTLQLEQMSIFVPGLTSRYYVLGGLRGNTRYNISVAATTKYVGVMSSGIVVRTLESRPTVSAVHLSCIPALRSIVFMWQHAPPAYLQGVRTNYKVYYQKTKTMPQISYMVPPEWEYFDLLFLDTLTSYTMWLVAYTALSNNTNGGEGAPSYNISCTTLESVPMVAPMFVNATNYYSPNSTFVEWQHIPDNYWSGMKLGYTIFYTLLKLGGAPVEQQPTLEYEVGLVEFALLSGLDFYATYKICVAGKTNPGNGPKSCVFLFTCNVPVSTLTFHYISMAPYITVPISPSTTPDGILPPVITKSLQHCAGMCQSFSTLTIKYNHIKEEDILPLTQNCTSHLIYPRLHSFQVLKDYSNIAIISTPGFVLLRSKNKLEKHSVESFLFESVLLFLPLIGLFVMLNILFGFLFAFIEIFGTKLKEKICCNGVITGIYFACITSTRVGYGDMRPLSNLGRFSTLVWICISIFLICIFISLLTTHLLSCVIKNDQELLPNNEVLTLKGSAEYHYVKRFSQHFKNDSVFSSYAEILDELHVGRAEFGLIDQYIAETLKTNIEEYNLHVMRTIPYPFSHGIAMYADYKRLSLCVTEYLKNNRKLLTDLAMLQMKERNEWKDVLPVSEPRVWLFLNMVGPFYVHILIAFGVVLLVAFVVGICLEMRRRSRAHQMKNRVFSETELLLMSQERLRDFSEELKTMIADFITSWKKQSDDLMFQQGIVLIRLRREISKMYGVNFKYVRTTDLGVSMELILQYKEDMKQRPEEPLSSVLKRKWDFIKIQLVWVYEQIEKFIF